MGAVSGKVSTSILIPKIEVVPLTSLATTSTALRLGKYFGTSPDFWLNLQRANDLYAVLKKEQDEIDKIQPLSLSREK